MKASESESSQRKWWICGLLLLALVLNYMDRQTLSQTITAIETELRTNSAQYGRLEAGFGYAFALGALAFGILADRLSIRWLYPGVLLGWSFAGLATGYADRIGKWLVVPLGTVFDLQKLTLTSDPAIQETFVGFLVCRVILGFFEAGQWPCALVTTQRLLSKQDRALGNSILQSGASLGAIFTPFVVGMFDSGSAGWWRMPFVVIGVLGVAWVAPWFASVWGISLERRVETKVPESGGPAEIVDPPWPRLLSRFLALVFVVVAINMLWQFFRAWLPKMLEQYHGYSRDSVRHFIVAYYIATDVGCICSGAAVKRLASRGWNVHRARMTAFAICTGLTSLSVVAAFLPKGPFLLGAFLLIGFGALGLFPNYYSFTQDLSTKHQGKVSGTLAFITWIVSSIMQERIGKVVDETGSYRDAILWIGLTPLAGLIAMLLLWGKTESTSQPKVAT